MVWSRLESMVHTVGVTGGLEARVGDPMWMLSRQWQVGRVPRGRRSPAGRRPGPRAQCAYLLVLGRIRFRTRRLPTAGAHRWRRW
jgi:hypothetical protein